MVRNIGKTQWYKAVLLHLCFFSTTAIFTIDNTNVPIKNDKLFCFQLMKLYCRLIKCFQWPPIVKLRMVQLHINVIMQKTNITLITQTLKVKQTVCANTTCKHFEQRCSLQVKTTSYILVAVVFFFFSFDRWRNCSVIAGWIFIQPLPLPLSLVVSVAVPLASWGTTAATRVPRLPSRMDKRVASDKEDAADKQCLRRRKTLIPNRGRWSSLSLFRQIHLREGNSDFKPGQMEPA